MSVGKKCIRLVGLSIVCGVIFFNEFALAKDTSAKVIDPITLETGFTEVLNAPGAPRCAQAIDEKRRKQQLNCLSWAWRKLEATAKVFKNTKALTKAETDALVTQVFNATLVTQNFNAQTGVNIHFAVRIMAYTALARQQGRSEKFILDMQDYMKDTCSGSCDLREASYDDNDPKNSKIWFPNVEYRQQAEEWVSYVLLTPAEQNITRTFGK